MVYTSDFYTTRRAYSRPTVSSYSVSYPIYSYTPYRTVYTSSYPIYSYHSIPYVAHKRLISGTRTVTTPYRVFSSPIRSIRSPSPVRIIRTTRTYTPLRDLSPVRVVTLPSYTSPITSYTYYSSPITSYTSPITYPSFRTLPSVLSREYQRIENKYRAKSAYRPLEDYLNSSSYIEFDDESRRIRNEAASLLREIHTPVFRRARSATPFPATTRREPLSKIAFDAYISRITNPLRPMAFDSSYNLDPITRSYIGGKSHLASVRIVGNRAYTIRNPLYDPDRIRTDVEYLSRYLKNRRAASEKLPEKKYILDSAKLDPNRPTRKFSNAKLVEDPNLDIKEKQASRYEKLMSYQSEEDIELEKKKARRLEDAKRCEELAVQEETKKKGRSGEKARAAEIDRQEKLAQQAAAERAAEMERIAREREEARWAKQAAAERAAELERINREQEEARLAEEARMEEEARLEEEERLAEEERRAEEARLAEEARIEEARMEEERRAEEAEEARLIEEQRQAQEARLAKEARWREDDRLAAEEARLEDEQRQRDEELARLSELEKIAEEEREAELARQAAELAEIARQDSEIAAQELEAIQKTDSSKDINANVTSEEATEDEESHPIVEEPDTSIDEKRNVMQSPDPDTIVSDATETESEAE